MRVKKVNYIPYNHGINPSALLINVTPLSQLFSLEIWSGDLFSEFKPTYEDFIKKSNSNKMDEINELIKRRAGGFTLNELNVLFNFGKIDY